MENQVLHALQSKPNLSEWSRKQNLDQSASGTTYEKPMHLYEKEWIQSKTGQVKMDVKLWETLKAGTAPPVPSRLLLALCTLNTTVKQYRVQFGPASFHEASATLLQTSLLKIFQTSKICYSLLLLTLL